VRPRELERLAERERESEAVDEAEAERDRQTPAQPGRRPAAQREHDVLERHVDDRRGDERLDERGEPQPAGRDAERRGGERDRVGDGERRDDEHERAEAAEGDHQAEDEQQVVGAIEDVLEAEPDEGERRLVPARIEPHEAGVATVLEGPDRTV
jgi:hypothetical protein